MREVQRGRQRVRERGREIESKGDTGRQTVRERGDRVRGRVWWCVGVWLCRRSG